MDHDGSKITEREWIHDGTGKCNRFCKCQLWLPTFYKLSKNWKWGAAAKGYWVGLVMHWGSGSIPTSRVCSAAIPYSVWAHITLNPSDETLNWGPLALLLLRQYEFPIGINKVHFLFFFFFQTGKIPSHSLKKSRPLWSVLNERWQCINTREKETC